MTKNKQQKPKQVCYEFYVDGMHCAACELTIEKNLKKFKGVKKVDADLGDGKVTVEGVFNEDVEELAKDFTKLVKKDGYEIMTENPVHAVKRDWKDYAYALPIAVIVILLFWILQRSGILNTTYGVSFTAIFLIGVVASLSSCAAVVGGLVLSISANLAKENSGKRNLNAQISFHAGRLIGFFFLGGLLGLLGGILATEWIVSIIIGIVIAYFFDYYISKTFSKTAMASSVSFLVFLIAGTFATEYILEIISNASHIEIYYFSRFALSLLVVVVMIILGINLLEIFEFTKKFQLRIPKALSHTVLKAENINKWFGPILLGALTFFLPCGITQTMQAEALKTGSFWQSAMIMFVFALGTLPVLAIISFASVNLGEKVRDSKIFFKVSGLLVLAFAIYNLLGALAVIGFIGPIGF